MVPLTAAQIADIVGLVRERIGDLHFTESDGQLRGAAGPGNRQGRGSPGNSDRSATIASHLCAELLTEELPR